MKTKFLCSRLYCWDFRLSAGYFFGGFFIHFFCLFLQNFWKEKVSAYSVTVLCAVLTYASKYVDQILIEKEVTEEFSIKLQTGNLCFTLSHIMEIKQNLGFI